jgi:hypothetical protein
VPPTFVRPRGAGAVGDFERLGEAFGVGLSASREGRLSAGWEGRLGVTDGAAGTERQPGPAKVGLVQGSDAAAFDERVHSSAASDAVPARTTAAANPTIIRVSRCRPFMSAFVRIDHPRRRSEGDTTPTSGHTTQKDHCSLKWRRS